MNADSTLDKVGATIASLVITVIAFFLGWGLKDVKKRYDRIPEIERELAVLKQRIEFLEREVDSREP